MGLHLDPARKLSAKPVWHIPLLFLQWKTPDDGQKNCLKHVEFYFRNKFEKLVHLVGFTIRIHHDARSPERQICYRIQVSLCHSYRRISLRKIVDVMLLYVVVKSRLRAFETTWCYGSKSFWRLSTALIIQLVFCVKSFNEIPHVRT